MLLDVAFLYCGVDTCVLANCRQVAECQWGKQLVLLMHCSLLSYTFTYCCSSCCMQAWYLYHT